MGIRNLAKFINEKYTGWMSVNLNDLDKLVIDGDSICYQLYMKNHLSSCDLGGDYYEFHSSVREFLVELQFTGVQLIIVFCGISNEQEKMETVRKYRIWSNEKLRKSQGQMGRCLMDEVRIAPPMMTYVFMDVLRSLDIQFYVADNDDGKEVAALANQYQCPVLAANSDFFMFKLDFGYLPFDQLSTIIANGLLYCVDKFQHQFSLKDVNLRLIIPAIHGNGSVKRLVANPFDFEDILRKASAYGTCEEYLAAEENQDICRNFEICKSLYCDLDFSIEYEPDGPSTSKLLIDLPKWIAMKYRSGCFQPQLLNVHVNRTCVLEAVVEDIKQDSAWLTSRQIRQYLFGFMGIPPDVKIREVIRAKSSPNVIESLISAENFDSPLDFREFDSKDKSELANVVLAVLKYNLSHEDLGHFNMLDDKWKLPTAATFYWYQMCNNPPAQRHLVKSLLLCFLMCSKIISDKVPPLDPITRETKSDHLRSLHAFAQWQCVYCDAMALNYLAREPFVATNPSSLFSGKVAMYYASLSQKNVKTEHVLADRPEEWALLNNLLYLITGSDGKGRIGSHAKYQPKPKRPFHTKEEDPSFAQANPFDLLLDTDDPSQ